MGLARFVDREGRKRGVRATAICPGVVRPSAAQQQIPDEAAPAFRDLALNDAAAQEAVSAAEVAAAVLRFAAAEPRALAS
jgi:NAD(P)-dependent dehydrogenase (short-subunit alcohol dehydrogenase family)